MNLKKTLAICGFQVVALTAALQATAEQDGVWAEWDEIEISEIVLDENFEMTIEESLEVITKEHKPNRARHEFEGEFNHNGSAKIDFSDFELPAFIKESYPEFEGDFEDFLEMKKEERQVFIDAKKVEFENADFEAEFEHKEKHEFERPEFVEREMPEFEKPEFERPEFIDGDLPEFEVPAFERPEFVEVDLPELELPEFEQGEKPKFERPEFPKDDFEFELPDFELPDVEVDAEIDVEMQVNADVDVQVSI
ncbi:hypothetical protein [Marinicellulosiphila megalodicopiae]|uniref:hypothetical protein n=1 Tax=Marinicellulosiphila megalodicopiae TaxID=2724896 RepID=UPI003BB17EAC